MRTTVCKTYVRNNLLFIDHHQETPVKSKVRYLQSLTDLQGDHRLLLLGYLVFFGRVANDEHELGYQPGPKIAVHPSSIMAALIQFRKQRVVCIEAANFNVHILCYLQHKSAFTSLL